MALALSLLALAAHLATDWRYGYFRDELYFIACSKHLAWGYVDQPPLVAIAAFLSSPFHYNLILLRLLPSLSAALTVFLAGRIARELGGGRFAETLAALCALLLPAYLLLGNTLTTTSFEPLSWTFFFYAIIRLVRTGDERYWLAAAAAFTFGMYGKYSMLLPAAAIVAGLLLTPQRRVLVSRWFAAACAVSAALLLPNIWWQWSHAWPFVHVVQGDFEHRHAFQTGLTLEYKTFAANAGAFVVEQIVYTNPVLAAIWLSGLGAFAFSRTLRDLRCIAIAYALTFVLAIWLEAKGYYIIGFYAVLAAAGSTMAERIVAAALARTIAVTAVVVTSLVFLPLSLPVLPVDSLISYTQTLRLTGNAGQPARLIQPLFAEEFGWDELAQHVASVYRSLPAAVRAHTGIFADTYGDAGALEFYGPRYGLPRVISAQNTYYLWGPGDYDGRTLIVVGASQAQTVRPLYRKMTLVATYGNAYKWVVEGPTPIYLCRDPIAPLPDLWPRLKWYGA
ncbi:MAG TPA: glycosyltransferase family 39 protein [Candidatus Baltobacteraceae bacterium]|jgi:hypothetical protein|nr:glycosyltransferase family 39 protein [Candidatus Baltobacteraceae bacterium]